MTSYFTTKINDTVKIRMGEGFEGMEPITVAQQFETISTDFPDKEVMQGCDDKIFTYSYYYDQVIKFAKSLVKVGFKRFDSLNIIGFNSYHYCIGFLGCIFAGGVSSGIYTTNNPGACKYCAETSNCRVVLCDGMKELDKYLEIQDSFKPLCYVVYNCELTELPSSSVKIFRWSEFMEYGNDIETSIITNITKDLKPGQCCSMIYTSGTTGNPKVVLISHDNFIYTAKVGAYSLLNLKSMDDLKKIDEIFGPMSLVSYLPLSHVAAQILDIFIPIVIHLKVYFARPDALKGSLLETLKKVRPTVHLGVPRVWEKMKDQLTTKLSEGSCIKKCIVSWAQRVGSLYTNSLQFGSGSNKPSSFCMANSLLYKKVKEGLGFDRVIIAVSSAAPIHRDVIDFFGRLSIPVYEVFGQSEGTGPVTINNTTNWKIGTVGKAMAGIYVGTESSGELVYYGRNCFMGYKDNIKDTEATYDSKGYLHTGDLASVDSDGFFTITGRIKELIITAGGENITPLLIEDHIKQLIPSLSNAVLIGDRMKFLSILLTFKSTPDGDGAPTDVPAKETLTLAKQIGSTISIIPDIPKCPKFNRYIQDKIDYYNKNLAISQAQNVRKFTVLTRDFSLYTGELTPTLKLKRNVVTDMYSKDINKMYVEVGNE